MKGFLVNNFIAEIYLCFVEVCRGSIQPDSLGHRIKGIPLSIPLSLLISIQSSVFDLVIE